MKLDFKKRITEFHYGRFSFILFLLFFIPSIFYYLIISIKNFLYEINLLKEKKIGLFVICAGNLTTGGVGKTPVVIELANYFSSKGKKTAILSRGYKSKLDSSLVHIIRTYDSILMNDANIVGDEISLISKNVNGCALILSKDRFEGARCAKEKLGAEILIMDDGFSNRKIYKNFNLLLVDYKNMFGNGFCLPLGPLREPVRELKRADRILFVDKTGQKNKKIDKFIKKLNIPYSYCKIENGEVYNIKTKEPLHEKAKIVVFSGIGQNEAFFLNLKEKFEVIKTVSFSDHYEYSQKDIDHIISIQKEAGASKIVTTEKDMVKILNLNNIDDIYALKIKAKFDFDIIK